MGWMIWAGAGVTVVGVALLIWVIRQVVAARRENLTEDQMKDRLQLLVAWNMGALGLSAIGLMLVVIGLVFG